MADVEIFSLTRKDAEPCRIAAFPRLAERPLKVRGEQIEIAVLERADGGGLIILRAFAIDELPGALIFLAILRLISAPSA